MPGKKDRTGTLSISFCKLAEVGWRNNTTGEVRVGNCQTRMGGETQFSTGPSTAPLRREGKAHVLSPKASARRVKPQRSESVPEGHRNRRHRHGLNLHLDHLSAAVSQHRPGRGRDSPGKRNKDGSMRTGGECEDLKL